MSDTTIKFMVDRDAGYENTVGFYAVDSEGNITDSESGETIALGDENYTEAAIANRADVSLNGVDGASTEFTAMFAGGSYYAPFLVVDGTIEQLEDDDSSNDPMVYFPWSDANLGSSAQIEMLAENTFGFEDLPYGGDSDFNDLVMEYDFA